MGKNLVKTFIVLFAVLAVAAIIYAVNNIHPYSPRPFEEVLIPENGNGEQEGTYAPNLNNQPAGTEESWLEETPSGTEGAPSEGTPSGAVNVPGTEESASGQPPLDEESIFCTMDAMICPDGSAVGRMAPDCEFAPCPVEYTE